MVFDRDGRILDEGLLQEATLLEELLQLALHNLGPCRLGPSHFLRLRQINGFLLLDQWRRNVFASDEGGTRGGGLEGDVVDECLELVVAGYKVGFTVELHEDDDAAAGMEVGRDRPFVRSSS